MFGYLQSLFAFVQLCGGPIYGRFGDLFGTRNALILAFLASASSYGLLAVASSFSVLLLSRLPSVCMHSFHGGFFVYSFIKYHWFCFLINQLKLLQVCSNLFVCY